MTLPFSRRLISRRGLRIFLDGTARALVDLMIRHSAVERQILRGQTVQLSRTTVVGQAVRLLAAHTGVPPSDPSSAEPFAWIAFPSFTRAAGIAALFDLKLRILSENSGALSGDRVYRAKLEEVAEAVTKRYETDSSAQERELIKKLAILRNKVLHVEFDSMTNRTVSLGESLGKEPVFGINLSDGKTTKVRGKRVQDATLVGWLLEARQSGAFDAAIKQLARGLDLITRWAELGYTATKADDIARTSDAPPNDLKKF